jgi:hypothetical protein
MKGKTRRVGSVLAKCITGRIFVRIKKWREKMYRNMKTSIAWQNKGNALVEMICGK